MRVNLKSMSQLILLYLSVEWSKLGPLSIMPNMNQIHHLVWQSRISSCKTLTYDFDVAFQNSANLTLRQKAWV